MQDQAFRNPMQALLSNSPSSDISPNVLDVEVTDGFTEILAKLSITLLITREYEHVVMALQARGEALRQSFITIPHPSGIAVDMNTNTVFIVSTRNPNQIWELKPTKTFLERREIKNKLDGNYLMPLRTKIYSGAYYFHDLAIIGDTLHAVSVGQNSVVEIHLGRSEQETPIWWPKCIETAPGRPDTKANYIQLNSIAAGDSLAHSFFSASSTQRGRLRPGHKNYPIDGKGVIFSGATREPIATGLTRPHSARLFKNTIWVDNSGYGEVGIIENKRFKPVIPLPGWTRGLCIVDHVLFVGTSRVLPRFHMYAPGIHTKNQICGIHAIDMKTQKILGSLTWPYGNQIFSIDWISQSVTDGFLFEKAHNITKKQTQYFFSYAV